MLTLPCASVSVCDINYAYNAVIEFDHNATHYLVRFCFSQVPLVNLVCRCDNSLVCGTAFTHALCLFHANIIWESYMQQTFPGSELRCWGHFDSHDVITWTTITRNEILWAKIFHTTLEHYLYENKTLTNKNGTRWEIALAIRIEKL